MSNNRFLNYAMAKPLIGKWVAVDFDGTLLKPGQWNEKSTLEIRESVIEAVRVLASKGVGILITTNRPEIFKGQMKQESYAETQNAIIEMLTQNGAHVLGVWFCPSTDKNDPFMKPNPGMFKKIATENGVNWKVTPVLAGSIADVKAGAAVGADVIIIENENFNLKSLGSLKLGKNFTVFPSLLDYANSI